MLLVGLMGAATVAFAQWGGADTGGGAGGDGAGVGAAYGSGFGGGTGGFGSTWSGTGSGATGASGAGAAAGTGVPDPATAGRPGLPLPADAARRARSGSTGDPARESVVQMRDSLGPNEFQRFVQQATGRLLPMFGAELFERVPDTFAPVAAVPVPADYVIGPGDELLVRSTGVLEFELQLEVDRNGQIVLPQVGAVSVAGQRAGGIEAFLRAQVARSYRNFALSVTMGRLRSIDIYVVGAARQPGRYTVGSLSTLVNALFASGGPGPHGSLRRIQLLREGRLMTTFDVIDFVVRGDKSRDLRLQPGDVIVVPPAGPRVAMTGATRVAAIIELPPDGATIAQLLETVGGLPVTARPQRVSIERLEPGASRPRRVETFELGEAAAHTPVRDGDILSFGEVVPAFSNAVTLRGAVAAPGRVPWRPGMTVRSLIPDTDALITRDYWRRKNALVQFERAPLGPARERGADAEVPNGAATADADVRANEAATTARVRFPADASAAVAASSGRGGDAGWRRDPLDAIVRDLLDEVNWDYALIERIDPRDLVTRLLTFDLGRAVLDGDPQHDLPLQPGDIVTIFSKADVRVPQDRRTRIARIEGEVRAPGIYPLRAGETLAQLLERAGGATGQAYLFGTELHRVSVREEQQRNLETVLRRLEDEINVSSATRRGNLTAADPGTATLLAAQVQADDRIARQRLERMRRLQPTGRVSLELDPELPRLPFLALEDGDRIVIPPRPGFVSAIGAVNNENAILWRPDRNLGDYLPTIGLNRASDADEMFVLRADGSIVGRRERGLLSGWFSPNVRSLRLMPGDTVIVPERLDRESTYATFMRGLKDWTQVLAQLGLGAAAIRTLR